MIVWLLVLGMLGLSSPATAEGEKAAQPLTLVDCYALALKRSEEIAIRQELIAEAEGRFSQALSGALPRVSFSSSDKRQDGSGDSLFTLRSVPERKFVFSQPLFSGFKEFSAMAATKAQEQQRALEKTRAQQLLFLNVSDAFYLLLEKREDIRILEEIRTTLITRIEELQERERLGRSRRSEAVSAEAQLRRVEAEEELVRGEETLARQLLEFLTGREPIGPIAEPDPSFPHPNPDGSSLTKSSSSRPDVLASQEAEKAAEKNVSVAKAAYWPKVSVDGNYYVERVGTAKDVSWDVALKVDVPIFQGGEIAGAVKEASSQAEQARLRSSEAGRKAIREIRDSYAKLQSSIVRTNALARALEAMEENFRLQVEDYRLNLINNLEVLRSLQDLQNSRQEFMHAQYDMQRLYWDLKVATGDVP